MGKTIDIGGRIHNPEVGNVVTGANEILDDTKNKKQDVINSEVDAALEALDANKQDNLTFDQTPTEDSTNPVTSGGVYAADLELQQAIEAILTLIPSAASALNQLADKSFVNSSIATASATFRGTYNLVNDLHLSVTASHQDIATALASVVSTADNNDYCFVQIPTSDTSSDIRVTERYKFNGTAWAYEYDLNNSGFTAQQWEAINSGITALLVQKLGALPTAAELATSLAGKQNVLTFDNVPVSGSDNPVKSGGLYQLFTAIDAKFPSDASSSNKLVAENRLAAYVSAIIEALDASFDLTSADGHVTFRMTQTNGVIASVQILTSDIASASALTTIGGQVSTNASDIAALQALYNALQQSAPQIIQPSDTWPVANPSTTVIYRVIDRVNTPPQYYSDYMYNGTSMVLMAIYNNAIDAVPTAGSNNLVKSGGVFDSISDINRQIGLKTLDVVYTYSGYIIDTSGNIGTTTNPQIRVRVFDVSQYSEIYFEKAAGLNPSGVFCTDYQNINTTKIEVIPQAVLNKWVKVPSTAVYAVLNVLPQYENNNVYAKVKDGGVVNLKTENVIADENRDYIEDIIGEYKALDIVKTFDSYRFFLYSNRLEATTSDPSYNARAVNVEGLKRVLIDKGIYLQIGGFFCQDITDVSSAIFSAIGSIIPNVQPPLWVDVPEGAKYLVVNAIPSYEANNVFPKILQNPVTSLKDLENLYGLKNLNISNAIADSEIDNSGNIISMSGYVIRVFELEGNGHIYIDKFIGNLSICGVFCTDSTDVIGTKVGDFIPKQITPNWIDVPKGALYFAVNSYPSYAPNDIYAKVVNVPNFTIQELDDEIQETRQIVGNANGKKPIICSQWNVGQFGDGASQSTITPQNYNEMVVKWNKEVGKQDATLCGLIEYNPVFGVNPDNVSVSPDDVVWNCYLNNIVYRRTPTANWYGGCAINTQLNVISSEKVKYECFRNVTVPSETQQDMLNEAFYTLIIAEYMGLKVKIAECSCPFDLSTPSDNTYQRMVYNELVATFGNESHVILMGDFELVDNDDYDIFTNGGFTLANGGEFGWFPTCPDSAALVQGVNALDNIIVKGFDITDVEMSNSTLSDHFPLIATLEIKDDLS